MHIEQLLMCIYFYFVKSSILFVKEASVKRLLLKEIGVGYNTPSIIRFPFENMTYNFKDTYLVRINKDYPSCPSEIKDKSLSFDESVEEILFNLK